MRGRHEGWRGGSGTGGVTRQEAITGKGRREGGREAGTGETGRRDGREECCWEGWRRKGDAWEGEIGRGMEGT